MKTFIFKRQDNNFSDILNDPSLKNIFKTQLSWDKHILLYSEDNIDPEVVSYILLKYGDDIFNITDFSPVPYVDYQPDPNRPEKYKNVYKQFDEN